MKTIDKYGKNSGYKLNRNKCKSLPIGKQTWLYDINENLGGLYDNNYKALVTTIRQDLNRWELIPEFLIM